MVYIMYMKTDKNGRKINAFGRTPLEIRELDYKRVEELAYLGMKPKKIMRYLNVREDKFNSVGKHPKFRDACDRGTLRGEEEILKALMDNVIEKKNQTIISLVAKNRLSYQDKPEAASDAKDKIVVQLPQSLK